MHARNLPALLAALAAADAAGVGQDGDVAAGLLHTAKLLGARLGAEAAATADLLAAVKKKKNLRRRM